MPPALAVIATGVEVVTALVGIAKVALVAACGTNTLVGTVAAAVLLLDSDTANPAAGAPDVRVTFPCEEVPPVTFVGFTETVVLGQWGRESTYPRFFGRLSYFDNGLGHTFKCATSVLTPTDSPSLASVLQRQPDRRPRHHGAHAQKQNLE